MASDNEPSPESGLSSDYQKNKKRRLAGACDACRKRKTKCDSAQKNGDRCTHCQTADIRCTHDIPRQPTKSELTAAYIQTLEGKVQKVDKMYRLLQRVYPGKDIDKLLDVLPESAEDDIHNKSDRTGLGNEMRSPQLNFNLPLTQAIPSYLSSPSLQSGDSSDDSEETEDDLSHIALAKHLTQLKITVEPIVNHFFGPASTFMFLKQCSDLRKELTGLQPDGSKLRRPVFWHPRPWEIEYAQSKEPHYVFPDEHLLHDLSVLYFGNINTFFPLLHQPTFFKMILAKQHLWDQSFAATVLLVCALGARYSQDPRVFLAGDTSGLSSGWSYFCQVPLHQDGFLRVPTLFDLQYYCLAHLYLLSSNVPHVAWNILGLAMQAALGRGAHRRSSMSQKPSKEEELMKRAFWCLVVLDRMSSTFCGRPYVIGDEEFDLDYPIECDDEYWETNDPDSNFKQPPGKPCSITVFVCLIKLLEVLSVAHRTLYSTKKAKTLSGLVGDGWEQRVVTQLDSSMNQWKDSLPNYLRWDPERTECPFLHQTVTLHCTFAYVQIQIHRPFLTKKSPLSFASLAMCANAARSCAHVMEVGMNRGKLMLTPPIITCATVAGLVISLNLWGCKRSGIVRDTTKELNDLRTCLKVLKMSEKRWHIAGRAHDMLSEVTSSVEEYQATRNKRPRALSHSGESQPLYYQSNAMSFMPPTPLEPASINEPFNTAAISDWDLLLMQMGNAQSGSTTLNEGRNSGFITSHNISPIGPNLPTTTNFAQPVRPSQQDPEYPIIDDLFSLWSDVPVAYSQDEWDVYLANLGKSSFS